MNHARQRDRQIVREMAHAKARRFGKSIGPDEATQAAIRCSVEESASVAYLYERGLLRSDEARYLMYGDK